MKKLKKKVKLTELPTELDAGEVALIVEALKSMEKRVREERDYKPQHLGGLYKIYLERYWKLINKFSREPLILKVKFPKQF